MKVLGLASYPVEAAATRYRLAQFVGPLADRGIILTIRPFLDSKLFARLYRPGGVPRKAFTLATSALRRMKDLLLLNKTEVVLIQREAMIFGPPLVEWLAVRVLKRPMVLDLDDATYVSYTSPTYGRLGKTLKWFSKTDDLISWASIVTCGNRAIAEYAESKGATACIIPTVVDAEVFRPANAAVSSPSDPLVLGWIGTHSTFPYLEAIFPILQKLAGAHHFKLRIVGAGKERVAIPGVEVENLEWKLEREVADFQSFDIGLYPIDPTLYAEKWAAGKSGFKAIQYMAVGIPFVAAPVGAMAEIGKPGVTHFHAVTNEEWSKALTLLLSSKQLREAMGSAGRQHVVQYYSLEDQAEKLAQALRQAAGKRAPS
jgi:glycosyltransferase involved in cell wall biosynthesis